MPIKITIKNAGGGNYRRVPGKRIDQFLFKRHPIIHGQFELVMSVEEFHRQQDDLFRRGNPPMSLEITPEASPESTELAEKVKTLEAAAQDHQDTVEGLQSKVERLESQLAEGGDAESSDTANAYDALLDALQPHVIGGESPLDTLNRIIFERNGASQPAEGEAQANEGGEAGPPSGYNERLKYAKEVLGLSFPVKPSRADLDAAVDLALKQGKDIEHILNTVEIKEAEEAQ